MSLYNLRELADNLPESKIVAEDDCVDLDVLGVSINTRTIKKGEVFLCLRGDNFDGHNFVFDAIKKGASLIISEVDIDIKKTPYIKVKSSYQALVLIAKYNRFRLKKSQFIGITGTVGKTSVKEIISEFINAADEKVYSTKGNYNNDIGLPLCLANMPQETKIGVFELGMSAAGEIKFLSQILQPDIAIITAISPVHMDSFSSLKDVAKAKSEIFLGNKGATAIIPRDSEFFDFIKQQAIDSGIKNIIDFGKNERADYSLVGVNKMKFLGKEYTFCQGDIIPINLLISVCCVNQLGFNIGNILSCIQTLTPFDGRGKIYHLKNNITVIDDSYNSNPAAMQNALENLDKFSKNEKIFVIGDMLDLGKGSRKYHTYIASEILKKHPKKIFINGEKFKEAFLYYNKKNISFISDNTTLLSELKNYIKGGEVILFKGSNSTLVHKIAKHFIEEFA